MLIICEFQIVLGDSNTRITVFDKSTREEITVVEQGANINLDAEDNSTVVVTMPGNMELKGVYYIHMDEG